MCNNRVMLFSSLTLSVCMCISSICLNTRDNQKVLSPYSLGMTKNRNCHYFSI